LNGRRSTKTPALCTALAAGIASTAWASPPPLFADFHYLMPDGWTDTPRSRGGDPCETVPQVNYDGSPMLMPVNQPGGMHGGPRYADGAWMSWFANCFAQNLDAAGAPIGLLIRNRNCPFPYADDGRATHPEALAEALDALPKLDYLIMDLEWFGDESGYEIVRRNSEEIVRMVRSHPNPKISGAFIGNYNDSPNARDEAAIWARNKDRTQIRYADHDPFDKQAFYHNNFNMAMPQAYPLEIYSVHSEDWVDRGNATPNDRAAIFWAPLERVSAAARELPAGHVMVPWISNYVATPHSPSLYHAPPPTWEDIEALTLHIRLRGARSFVIWTSSDGTTHHPDIDYQLYRETAIGAWRTLDDLFSRTRTVEIVNLETEKTSPVQWSAVRAGDTLQVLVSNLDETESHACPLPLIGGVPAMSPPVGPGEHLMLTYEIEPAVRDFNGDNTVNGDDFFAYLMSFLHQSSEYPNAVGGAGGDWRDLNSDGLLDLRDLIRIATARVNGEFESFADDRRSGGTGLGDGSPG
jgi:hypothetical protein